MKDTFLTFSSKTQTAEYKVNGSTFVALAFKLETETDFKQILQKTKQLHPAAAHHCYAYILGSAGQLARTSDDREPANTAGKPILRALSKLQLTNVGIIVTRYFGGKLLGVPGLISAYGAAAEMVISKMEVEEKLITTKFTISGKIINQNELYKIVKNFGLEVGILNYQNETFNGIFEVRKLKENDFIHAVENTRLFTILKI